MGFIIELISFLIDIWILVVIIAVGIAIVVKITDKWGI